MIQEWLQFLPQNAGNGGLTLAIVGSLIGAGIWLLGARYSRMILTLATVLLGAVIGMHLPEWLGWNVSGAGPAVGGALILGITGYAISAMWVGIGFGMILASWAALACWIALRNGTEWTWPAIDANTTIVSYSTALWQGMPPGVVRIMPFACGAAMVSGLAMMIMWPKFSTVLCWSLTGATMLAAMGVAAVNFGQPQWLAKVPSPIWAQASILGAVVSLGALVQWKLSPRPAGAKAGKKKPKDDHDD
ncbi:MAG TPA: hypothetical protein VHD56_05920 [Tepidisphaeraceae bacterium]|nr:hypothetical protein [Tepidisphaeraceae bacterium]